MGDDRPLIPPHGGYRDLKAFQLAVIIHDGTVVFTKRFVDPRSRTVDQMVQAARSGKQNIAEGSQASAASKKTELRLTQVARASLEELLLDYEDYLRQNSLSLWEKDHLKSVFIRKLQGSSFEAYRVYIEEKSPETAANTLICLIHQANYLLDRLMRSLEQEFVEQGGFSEKLYRVRVAARKRAAEEGESGRSDRSDESDR
ncbi:MAG: four helix bundle suffix domain-containing protein [Fimbriimonadaceae bacterium]|nr:four helix bundle suffix domain-containing protein [Fimbriimonadaceae bacterium]